MTESLAPVLRPASVAVVGASRDPSKRGHQALRALTTGPYRGKVFAVNPRGEEVLGMATYRTALELPEPVDLACITTPAATVPAILGQCSQRGIKGAVVSAVGFREAGGTGASLEHDIARLISDSAMRLVGPNTSGIVNTAVGLNLVGIPDVPVGDLALLSQSGNIALDVINAARRCGAGISVYVGVGNETDITFHEYLDYLATDPGTRAVMMYVEGFRDGRRFIEVARRVSLSKPVVLLKGGRSDRGVAAARSHTGAIAGSYPVLRAALRQGGVSEVQRSDELLPVARALATLPPIAPGAAVAVLSDGGGHGTLMADALADLSVPLADLAEATRTGLRTLLGAAASLSNPVDVAGAADRNPGVLATAVELLAQDPSVGGIVLVGLFGGYAIRFSEKLLEVEVRAAHTMTEVVAHSGKPLVVHSLYAYASPDPLRHLAQSGVSVVDSIEVGSRCMRALHARGLHLNQEPVPAPTPGRSRSQPPSIVAARRERRAALMETEARELLVAYGVPLAEGVLCRSADETAAAITAAARPVALKIVTPSISHKSDAGGVVLGVTDPAVGRQAFATMLRSASEFAVQLGLVPDIRGLLIMPMQREPIAELIVGVRDDADFGPVLTVGAGGVAVEIHHDIAIRGLPIGRTEALEMLSEVRISRLLDGYRGRPAADRDALADVILGVAACALAHQEIAELEANPVFAYEDAALVIDARAFLKQLDQPARELGDAPADDQMAG